MTEKILAAFIAVGELEKAIAQTESLINEIFDAASELDEAQAADLYVKVIMTRKRMIVLNYAFKGLEAQLSNLLRLQDKGYGDC